MSTSAGGFTVTRTPANTPAAATLLLIHGFLDDASVWAAWWTHWAVRSPARATTYPVSARAAQRGEASAVTLASLAAEAAEVLEDIAGPVIVVGQSLGTQVAELVAARHPTASTLDSSSSHRYHWAGPAFPSRLSPSSARSAATAMPSAPYAPICPHIYATSSSTGSSTSGRPPRPRWSPTTSTSGTTGYPTPPSQRIRRTRTGRPGRG